MKQLFGILRVLSISFVWIGIAEAQNPNVDSRARVLQRPYSSVGSTVQNGSAQNGLATPGGTAAQGGTAAHSGLAVHGGSMSEGAATPVASRPGSATNLNTATHEMHSLDSGQAISESTSRGSFPSLAPRPTSSDRQGKRTLSSKPFSNSLVTVGCSLGVVLGLFAGLVWMTRRFGTRSMAHGSIPSEAMQPLGSAPIDARTTVTLVRCGSRILVLARTATGIQPLSEITDPKEVRHLIALCKGDAKKEFASTLQAIEREETPAGYVGVPAEKPSTRARGSLFATA